MSTHTEVELARLVSQLERQLSQRLIRCLTAAGSSVKEWQVVSALTERAGRTMTEIADVLSMPAPTATKLIDTMVANNLVFRRGDDTDRRRVLLYLAPRGRDKYERLAPIVAGEQAELSSLADGDDLPELVRLLSQLSERVG